MQLEYKEDYRFKIVFIGDTQVGKSSILSQYHQSKFDLRCAPTIGVDFVKTRLCIENLLMPVMQAWDTSGQEKFRTIIRSYFRSMSGFIIVYDITNRSSFLNLTKWIDEIAQFHELPNVPSLIVGNKADLEEKREVTFEEAVEFGDKVSIKVIETSAKDNMNLEDIFSTIARQVKIRLDIQDREFCAPPVSAETKPIEAKGQPESQFDPPKKNRGIFIIVMIGDSGVGKSNFLSQLCRNGFNSNYVPTIGLDFGTRVMDSKQESIKLQIWDAGGDPRFRSIVQSYYKGADAIVFIYDITNRSSFINLDSWLQGVTVHNGDKALKIVVGNKNDLEKERRVTYDEGKAYAETIGAYFLEFSAKKEDFQESFSRAFSKIHESL